MVHVAPELEGQMRTLGVPEVLVIALALAAPACKSKPEKTPPAAAVAATSASAPVRRPPPPRRNWPLPSGPVLAVLAGQGVGPIRIGATVATIERHMALPCEVKTPVACRYITRGVDFQLEKGVTKSIYVQRAGRPAGKDASGNEAEYGFFNGGIPPDLRLGMIPTAIQEHLGPPRNVERSDKQGTENRVEIHSYDGLRIEYDRIENGNLVMGGILVLKEPKTEADGGAGGASAVAPSAPRAGAGASAAPVRSKTP